MSRTYFEHEMSFLFLFNFEPYFSYACVYLILTSLTLATCFASVRLIFYCSYLTDTTRYPSSFLLFFSLPFTTSFSLSLSLQVIIIIILPTHSKCVHYTRNHTVPKSKTTTKKKIDWINQYFADIKTYSFRAHGDRQIISSVDW